MVYVLDAWQRFTQWQYWWMHTMVFIWLLFSVMLFVMEPRGRRSKHKHLVQTNISAETFAIIQRKHLKLITTEFADDCGRCGRKSWLADIRELKHELRLY
jgi:hypothetical protein